MGRSQHVDKTVKSTDGKRNTHKNERVAKALGVEKSKMGTSKTDATRKCRIKKKTPISTASLVTLKPFSRKIASWGSMFYSDMLNDNAYMVASRGGSRLVNPDVHRKYLITASKKYIKYQDGVMKLFRAMFAERCCAVFNGCSSVALTRTTNPTRHMPKVDVKDYIAFRRITQTGKMF